MPDMHRLGDIGAAEIDHHRLAVAGLGRAEPRVLRQRAGARGQRRVGEIEIDEAGTGDLDLGEKRIGLQPGGDLLGDGARIGLGRLGRGQRAIALELRQVGPVGGLHLAEGLRQTLRPRTPRSRSRAVRPPEPSWRVAAHLLVVVELRLGQLEAGQDLRIRRPWRCARS